MTKEWFFQEGDERIGPVTAAALKQLAGSGRIRPETLVWKNGMAGWAPARSVRGLISAEAATTGPPPLDPPADRDSAERADQSDGWHPFDILVSAAKKACRPDLPAAISRAAGTVGVYATYAAAFLTLVLGVVVAVHFKDMTQLWPHVGLVIAMLAIQYASCKFLAAGDRAIQMNPSTLPSSAVPDSVAVFTWLGTVVGVAGLAWAGVLSGTPAAGVPAMLVLVLGAFVSMAALELSGLSVSEKTGCLASEDAVGVLSFFVKLFLRCCPVIFAAAVTAGTIEIGRMVVKVVTSDTSGLISNIEILMLMVLNAIAIPAYAYLSAIIYYLTLDVVSAIVSLPAKVDAIAIADDKRPPGNA